MIKPVLFLVPVVALLSVMANAAPIDTGKSTVTSTGKQLGVAVTGKFKKVSGDVKFNPTQLAQSTANLVIDIASYDMGLPEYNKNILSTEWFDAAKFPKAYFTSTGIKGAGNQYNVTGKFTLKGKVQNIAFPVQFKQVGATQVFDGAFVVKRTAFGVGSGDWADTSVVADDVKVQFHLVVPVSK